MLRIIKMRLAMQRLLKAWMLLEGLTLLKSLTPLALSALFLSSPAIWSQSVNYRHHGRVALNDLQVTPGDTGSMTTGQLCSATFHTSSVRNVPESVKHNVCNLYGLSATRCTGQHVEIDHLISLELGGSNDPKNLWPQPYAPKPGAKEKDTVENFLHRQVCLKAITLDAAQKAIATDWYSLYLKMKTPK
jgi:hypothetical protein